MFLYHVPKGCDKKRGKMYRDLVIFGGRNTDGKADAPEAEGIFRWESDGREGHIRSAYGNHIRFERICDPCLPKRC